MVSSFEPHNMCANVERITTKTRCTSCTNWTISFKVQGFQTKTHMLQRYFVFLSLFQLNTFLHPTCNIQSHILKFQPLLNSDVTFRVDDFSCKKLFHPSLYAKVMPILLNSREILQIKSKFIFVNFPTK